MRLSSSIAFQEAKVQLDRAQASLELAQKFFQLADFLLQERRLTHCLVDQSRTAADRYQLYQRVNPFQAENIRLAGDNQLGGDESAANQDAPAHSAAVPVASDTALSAAPSATGPSPQAAPFSDSETAAKAAAPSPVDAAPASSPVRQQVEQAVKQLLTHRIPEEADLVQIMEELGLESLIAALGSATELEAVSDELFQVYNWLDQHHELRNTLGDRKGRHLPQRFALVQKLLAGQVREATLELVKRAVAVTARSTLSGAERASLSSQLRYYQNRLAESQGTVLATVQTVQELSDQQRKRLTQILEKRYQKPVRLHTQIVPELIGGAQIQIGAEIYDGTISSALQITKQKVAG